MHPYTEDDNISTLNFNHRLVTKPRINLFSHIDLKLAKYIKKSPYRNKKIITLREIKPTYFHIGFRGGRKSVLELLMSIAS